MKASVVIPTKNRLQQTSEAINSALTFLEIDEIVTVVDGDDDDVKKYSNLIDSLGFPCIKVIKNKLVQGAQGARVTGLLEAKNEIIVFLDSDDLLADGLKCLIEEIFKNKSIVMVYGNIKCGSSESNFMQLDGSNYLRVLRNLSLCPFSGLVVRRSLLDVNQINLLLPAWQDDDFCIQAAKSGPIKFVDVISAEYRISNESISKNRSKQFVGLSMLIEKNRSEILFNFGLFRIMLWRLRQFALLMQVVSDDLSDEKVCLHKGWKIPAIFFSKLFELCAKGLKFLLRPFFDRIYT